MSEPLSELLRLRITASQYQNINEAAALAGLSISEYARRTLTANNDMLNELRALRICVSDLTRTMQSEVAIIEILHLMRASASPSNINAAHSKMLEEGIKPLG
ncbi:plasmid mobilization protein [Paenalcaligenes sp. Me131]|uniref:plasmid mobilization protein n=1 Tax=Paenalcaligenes sp. Me131 TaxID=3392636 RepID=UPI003D27CE21